MSRLADEWVRRSRRMLAFAFDIPCLLIGDKQSSMSRCGKAYY
jgi:hypothetical protein